MDLLKTNKMKALPPHIEETLPPHYFYGRDAIDLEPNETFVTEVFYSKNGTPIFRVCGIGSNQYSDILTDMYVRFYKHVKSTKPIEEWVSKLTPAQEADIAKQYERVSATIKKVSMTEFDAKMEAIIKNYFKTKTK